MLYFDYLTREYDISLTEGQKDAVDWNLRKLILTMENGTYENDLKDQKNLGRFFRFGAENLFGVLSLVILAFIGLDSLPREYEKGTIITPYTQPYRKWKIIISKLLSLIFMSFVYIISVIAFTTIICKIQGYPITGLNSISRIITDEMVCIRTLEYLLICIVCFLVLSLLFYTFVLFIGSLTKSSSKTMVMVITLILVGYILTSSGYLEYKWNPFYLLNYSKVLLGKYEMPFTAMNETIYKKVDSIGYIPYIYMILPALLFLVLSIISQARTNTKPKRDKDSKRNTKISSLFRFELEKMKASNSFLFLSLISTMVLITIFSIMIIDDITMISKKEGPEGEIALRKKGVEYYLGEINYLEEISNNSNLTAKIRNEAKDKIKYYKESLEKSEHFYSVYSNIYKYYETNDSGNFYNELLKTIYTRFDKGVDSTWATYKGETGNVSEFAFITSFERVKELKARNITPILQTERQDTAYDEYIDSYEERVGKKYDQPLTHSGLYSVFRMNKDYYLSYILLIFVAIFFCGGYTYETEAGNQLIFLYTEPIDRRKYHYTKILSSLLYSTIFLIVFYLGIVMFGWLSEGLGDWNYPILHYDYIAENIYKQGEKFEGTYHFINLSSYILRVIVISVFSIGFIASLTTFISLKLKQKNYVIFAAIIISLIGVFVARFINVDLIKIFLPFTYLDVGAVADGSIKIIHNSNRLTMFMGICVLSLWSILLTALGMDFAEKREVK